MLIELKENKDTDETKITIECRRTDEEILQVIEFIKNLGKKDKKLICFNDVDTYRVEPKDVLYFESVERKTFCYTQQNTYETVLKLYEIESGFPACDYMRVSKSVIVNIDKIKSIRPDLGGKILATMVNGEKLYISRQYVPKFKAKLGIGGK